jgi:serine/threonine-protein kinase
VAGCLLVVLGVWAAPAGATTYFAQTLPFPSSGPGSLDVPQGVALDPAGDVFVANNDNNTVVELSRGGSVSTLPSFPTSGSGSLGFVQSLAVDRRGDVFVTVGNNTAVELSRNQSN